MAILCDKNTKLIVQGLGKVGQLHMGLSLAYGTQIVGGIAPGKGGQEIGGVPTFDTVEEAVKSNRCRCLGNFCATALCGGCCDGSGGSRP